MSIFVRSAFLNESQYAYHSHKYRLGVSSWWFAFELLRKLFINLVFLLGQNQGWVFGWKSWVFLALVGSMCLNVWQKPHSSESTHLPSVASDQILLPREGEVAVISKKLKPKADPRNKHICFLFALF